jgi:threonine dehydrogenase-like Zn-dependent dehydrogenase
VPDEALRAVRRATRALKPATSGLPGPVTRAAGDLLLGGVDVAVDAVGSTSSLDLALRATRAGGRVVLSGMPSTGADLSPAWFRELEVAGTYAAKGEDFTTAFDLAAAAPLDGVVAGRYPLHRWREALDHAQSAGRLGSVKICFDVRSTS